MSPFAPSCTVDVVIPARDAEDTVETAVRSARAQTRPPGRILLMDGCFSDRTAERARRAGAEVHAITGGGVSRARNQGVALSDATWIAFLDADDSWESDWLEKALDQLQDRPDAALLYGQARQIDEEGRDLSGPVVSLPSGDIYSELLTRSIVTTSACVRPLAMVNVVVPSDPWMTTSVVPEVRLVEAPAMEAKVAVASCADAVRVTVSTVSLVAWLREKTRRLSMLEFVATPAVCTENVPSSSFLPLKFVVLTIRSMAVRASSICDWFAAISLAVRFASLVDATTSVSI